VFIVCAHVKEALSAFPRAEIEKWWPIIKGEHPTGVNHHPRGGAFDVPPKRVFLSCQGYNASA
jgi:hypothetical protein